MSEDTSSDGYNSDVSLDEEDEELIWRVFYSELDRKSRTGELDDNQASLNGEIDFDEDEDDNDEFEDISDLSDIDDPELVESYRQLKATKVDRDLSEEDKKRLLISHFTDDQMERFEAYRRMTVNKPGVKKICNGVLGQSIPQNIAIVLAGISKSFLGEIITRAFEVQEREFQAKLISDIDEKKSQKKKALKSLEQGKEVQVDDKRLHYMGDQPRPLQINHIREAYRLYRLESSGAFNSQWRREGDSDGKLFR